MNLTKSSSTRKILLSVIAIVFLLTIVATAFAYSYFRNQRINTLKERVISFAVALDAKEIQALTGSDEDLDNSSYLNLKSKLIDLQEYNSDTEFIYVMGQTGEDIFFYADSEPEDSEDYSPPGQIYDEASEVVYKVFESQTILTEVSSDRWGTWLSVMAPVVNKDTDITVALVGFDVAYQDFLVEIILFTALPAAVGLIILILLIATFVYAKKDEGIMQLRSEYFAIAAHDLRTPLTGIKFAMNTLRKIKSIGTEQKFTAIVEQINSTTENMLSSVNELLDGSSIEKSGTSKLSLTKTNITELLENTIKALEVSAKEKGIKVVWQVNKNLIIDADSDKLRRVFANIFSNAIKYSKNNGTIKVSAKKINNAIVISTKDSGIGIPAADQEKVFSGYFRASNAKAHTTQGTGMGLYYVKNVVEKHGGNVVMNSVPDKGTEIILSFPTN